jgi:hypothetical protein
MMMRAPTKIGLEKVNLCYDEEKARGGQYNRWYGNEILVRAMDSPCGY